MIITEEPYIEFEIKLDGPWSIRGIRLGNTVWIDASKSHKIQLAEQNYLIFGIEKFKEFTDRCIKLINKESGNNE